MRSAVLAIALVAALCIAATGCSDNDDIPAPVLGSVTPDSASAGATVTISGTYLCQQPGDGSSDFDPLQCDHTGEVTFGVVPATISAYTDTSVTAQVPDVPTGSTQIQIAVGGRTTNTISFTIVAP